MGSIGREELLCDWRYFLRRDCGGGEGVEQIQQASLFFSAASLLFSTSYLLARLLRRSFSSQLNPWLKSFDALLLGVFLFFFCLLPLPSSPFLSLPPPFSPSLWLIFSPLLKSS